MSFRFLMSLFISIFVPVSSCLFSGTVASAAAERGKRLPARVTRVFDGASFQVGGGLRGALIGITAPSLNARGGKESFAFLRGLLEGKNVRLEIDKNLVDAYGGSILRLYGRWNVCECAGPSARLRPGGHQTSQRAAPGETPEGRKIREII